MKIIFKSSLLLMLIVFSANISFAKETTVVTTKYMNCSGPGFPFLIAYLGETKSGELVGYMKIHNDEHFYGEKLGYQAIKVNINPDDEANFSFMKKGGNTIFTATEYLGYGTLYFSVNFVKIPHWTYRGVLSHDETPKIDFSDSIRDYKKGDPLGLRCHLVDGIPSRIDLPDKFSW